MPAERGTPSPRPLEGIRVVDFGWVAVGPVLSSLLAEFGAEVVKVESSRRLDYCRLIPTPLSEEEAFETAYAPRALEIDRVPLFHQYNRGKLGITVDLRHAQAPVLLRRLAAASDVVVENFSPRVLRELGLDYPSLCQVKPDLVMISCSAAGQGGPWEAVKTFAPSLSSLAGLERLVGYPGERPLGALTLGYADPSNAHHGLFAVLAALWHRRRTGEGQWIDMSQLEATAGLVGEALMDAFMNGRVWEAQGARHASLRPHGIYSCLGEDQWVEIACEDEPAREALRRLVGLAAGEELSDERISRWTRTLTPGEATERCQAAGIAAAPVLGLDAHTTHPHFQARGAVRSVAHPELGRFALYASPIRLGATPGAIDRAAPRLGEHNDRVFRVLLGLSQEEIVRLERDGVIV